MAVNPSAWRGSVQRRFYTAAATATALVVLLGFARTYYLQFAFDTPALPSLLVHAHGVVMTLWFALFVVQAALVARGRVGWHRRLGVFGALLALSIVVVGVAVALGMARRGEGAGMPPLVFLVVPLGDMVVFSALAGAGLLLRRRPAFHKRLMLLASMGLLAAAVTRIPVGFIETGGPLVFFGLTDLFILTWVLLDTVKYRRLHPAFAWGTLLILVSQPVRLWLGETAAWSAFAGWLVG